jgi:hypothetical protein
MVVPLSSLLLSVGLVQWFLPLLPEASHFALSIVGFLISRALDVQFGALLYSLRVLHG